MENFVIAITRYCGSGGKTVGAMLAKEFGISLYDRELLRLASDDSGISEDLFINADERLKSSILYSAYKKVYKGEVIPPESDDFTSNDNLFNYQAKVLKELLKKESYIVIGRAADYVLKDYKNVFKILLMGSFEDRVKHEMELFKYDRKEAEKHVKTTDKYRKAYYNYHTGQKWEDARNYDLCLDTGKLGFEKSAQFIKEYVKQRME